MQVRDLAVVCFNVTHPEPVCGGLGDKNLISKYMNLPTRIFRYIAKKKKNPPINQKESENASSSTDYADYMIQSISQTVKSKPCHPHIWDIIYPGL